MLETANWVQTYFNQSPDAIFLFKNDDLLVSNQPAQQLIASLKLNVDYLLRMGKNAWSQHEKDNCASCLIKGRLNRATIPVVFNQDSPHPFHFSLIYQPLSASQNIIALTLENREQQQRISQVEQQRILNQYISEAHEKERQKISQDLHDSIAQEVYSAIIGVHRLATQPNCDSQRVQKISTAVEKQLRATLMEIKNMALNIRPSVLDNFGLIPAIKGLAKRVQASTGIRINVVALTSADNLSANVQNVLYRISQEAINNAVKHANPTEINIIMTNHHNYIKLEVLDNGTGFDSNYQASFNGHSLGLMNMNERVKAYNGAFIITSKINKGTTVKVEFPYNNLNKDQVK
ncbi:sensor histidine kinase [Lactobacillus sp. 0.1XD8-4]|uniref:sensor histidine kinase n=1 Tax=uncultured Limosilactobacillus sp. TaxID=2837629 RepID=UPI00129EA189|nr:sensor histidine kinase [uncultured Limosilactobacillus sp.]MRN06774.1 sensor histidine kinase [Lactobacillus sp. 0.1XD8-4]